MSLESLLDTVCSHRRGAMLGILIVSTLVAIADYATGDTFPLIVCYLPCIVVTCWISHVVVATSLSMVCCCGWIIDDILLLEQGAVSGGKYWITFVHFMFFLAVIGTLIRLRMAHERQSVFADTDDLTGLLNHRGLRTAASQEIARAQRLETSLSVAFIDCDDFKVINDTLGHSTGDSLLRTVTKVIRHNCRRIDIGARVGGDEFAIILPNTTLDEARVAMQRLNRALQESMAYHQWKVTFSIGVAVYNQVPASVDKLLHGADLLMYEQKQNGKNGIGLREVAV